MNNETQIKELVKEKYAAIAEQSLTQMLLPAAVPPHPVVATKYITS